MKDHVLLYCCLLMAVVVTGVVTTSIQTSLNITCAVSNSGVNCFDSVSLPFFDETSNNFKCSQVCLNCTFECSRRNCCNNILPIHVDQVQCTVTNLTCNNPNINCIANVNVTSTNDSTNISFSNSTDYTITGVDKISLSHCPNISTTFPSPSTNLFSATFMATLTSTTTTNKNTFSSLIMTETSVRIMIETSSLIVTETSVPLSTAINTSVLNTSSLPTSLNAGTYIGIGVGGLIGVIIVVISILICFIMIIKTKRKRQVTYEIRNRKESHNYITRPSEVIVEPTAETSSGIHQVISTTPSIGSTPLSNIPASSNSALAINYKGNPLYSSISEDSLKFKRWKAVFSSVIVNRENIKLTKDALGEGAFGKVYKGTLKLRTDSKVIKMDVAVKTLKPNPTYEQVEEFISESAVMLDFDHPNVLKLLGVCFDSDDQLPVIILPYMANGDLKSYLRNQRKQPNVQYNQFPEGLNHIKLLCMCLDIAKGMEYLSRKKFVHRDLAARNCVINSDLIVHVADFGLSRDVYSRDYYRMGLKAAKLPVKWMPPESLNDGIYDEKTDVWAFGVTCWEIFSLGRSPYPTIDNCDVLDYIETGHKLKKPALCEQQMYEVMFSCWTLQPENRATFLELVTSICDILRESQPNDNDESSHDYFTLEENSAAIANALMKKEHLSVNDTENFLSIELSQDIIAAQPYTEPMSGSVRNEHETSLSQDILSPQPYSLPVNEQSF